MSVHDWLTSLGTIVAIVMALAGWAYQIGVQNARVAHTQSDMLLLHQRVTSHHDNLSIHTTEEWRDEVREVLRRLETKIDRLPCKVSRLGCIEPED